MAFPNTAGRLLFLLWGSVDWPTVHRLGEAGRMPHTQALVERGTLASLSTSEPLTTEALLTTAATGLLADKHGVLVPAQVRADGAGVEPVGHRSWTAPAVWEVLQAAGLRTITAGWSATVPAASWPGIHVDERFGLRLGASAGRWPLPVGAVSPPALAAALAPLRVHPGELDAAALHAFAPALAGVAADDPRLATLARLLARAASTHAAVTHLLEAEPWDALFASYALPHQVRLAFAGAPPPFDMAAEAAYAFQDMMLGRLLELAGPDATVFIVTPDTLTPREGGGLQVQPRGTLLAAGPAIGPDALLPGLRLVDVVPTVLARFGIELACDGVPAAPLCPPGPRRNVALPPPEPEEDPAASLAALGYSDALTPAQAEAVQGVRRARLMALGKVLMRGRGQLAAAATAMEQALAAGPPDFDGLMWLARCRAIMRDARACLVLGQHMIDLRPANPWGHLVMATGAALGGDGLDPEPYLVSARELGSADTEVLARAGGLELMRNRPETASADFAAALALDPGMVEAAYGVGLALLQGGNDAAAAAALRRAVGLEYNQPLAQFALGGVLARLGHWRDAVTALEAALAQAPNLEGTPEALRAARQALAEELARDGLSD